MKRVWKGLVAVGLSTALWGEAMATEGAEQISVTRENFGAEPMSINQETLGETYLCYYAAATDYLDVLRYQKMYDWYTLPTAPGEFKAGQAATLRAEAGNRVVYHEILDKITTPWMSDLQKVKAIYDFPMYNFVRYDTTAEAMPSAYLRTAYDSGAVVALDRGSWLLSQGTGGCQEFATLVNRLMNTAGIPCFNAYGDYVNSNGSTVWHCWNRAQVDGAWYWYDVDVEGSVYRRGAAAPIYYLYHKETSYWRSNHNWDEAGVLAKEGEISSMNYHAPGTLLPYEGRAEIFFDGVEFVPSMEVCAYVDIDSDFFSESVMMMPYLELMEFFGFTAYWDGGVSALVLELGENRLEFYPGSRSYTMNGQSHGMAVPMVVIGEVDYISADEIMLLLGYELNMQFYQDEAGVMVSRAEFWG